LLPVEDFGVRHGFRIASRLAELPKPKEALARGKRWRPHRKIAAWCLWRVADGAINSRANKVVNTLVIDHFRGELHCNFLCQHGHLVETKHHIFNMNSSANRVALVTGANRGIGFEIARRLGRLGYAVLVGARDQRRGQTATERLKAEGFDAHLVILDVTYQPSIESAAKIIESNYGRLDALVNNAGIMHDSSLKPSETPLDTIREVFEANFFGVIAVTQTLLPLLRKSDAGRIVNLSSSLGSLNMMADPASFDGGYRLLGYGSSKAAINLFTMQLAHELRDTAIKVNAAHPGWIKKDMGGQDAPGTVEEGADTPVWLATLPESGPTGGFFYERKPMPW
jgi:NAD(P)-dependent dehydrogenase (short-subunit alcohol dehydrogenase family)